MNEPRSHKLGSDEFPDLYHTERAIGFVQSQLDYHAARSKDDAIEEQWKRDCHARNAKNCRTALRILKLYETSLIEGKELRDEQRNNTD